MPRGTTGVQVRSYRDLKVWQKAMDLVVASYRVTRELPPNESYGLVTQIRRAAVSVPSNIAEGHGREHLGDYLRHLSVANGSLMELETQILIAERLGYMPAADVRGVLSATAEVGRMLAGLVRALKGKRSLRFRPAYLKPDTGHLSCSLPTASTRTAESPRAGNTPAQPRCPAAQVL